MPKLADSFSKFVNRYSIYISRLSKLISLCFILLACNLAVAQEQPDILKAAYTASFDCRKANHPVEKIICGNEDLSKLDSELATTWRSFQAACPDPTQMRLHQQMAWIAEIRDEVSSIKNDKTLTQADVVKYQAISIRRRYSESIEGLRQEIADCQLINSRESHNSTPILSSPLDCKHPTDVVEKGICLREYVYKPAQQLHAAYVDAVTTCNDPNAHWRNPLTIMIDRAKYIAKANEENYGRKYTPENVEFGNLHTDLKWADQPWKDLKVFCQHTPVTERRWEMHITDASKQLEFTIKQLNYGPGETAAHLQVQDAKNKKTLLSIDLPSITINMEGKRLLVNSAPLYDNQGTINVGDFNFDGLDDFAVQVGHEGSYGGPNYSVFLRTSKGFTHNQRMSELTVEGLGFFDFNKKTKTLSTFSKSGCCDHWGITYKVVNNQPIPVHMSRDYIHADDVEITEESVWQNNKWKVIKSRKNKTIKGN